MPIHVALTHTTRYRYARPISLSPQIIRLRPAPHCRTPILSYSLKVMPGDHFMNWQQDPFGNFLARAVFLEKTDAFSVTVDLVADMSSINPFDFFIEEAASAWPFTYEPELARELAPYMQPAPAGPLLSRYLAEVDIPAEKTIDYLCDLNRDLERRIEYLVRMEPGVQTPEETLQRAAGSCRDSGWLMVQILRHRGLAARFVSGYLIQLKPDVKALDGPSGTDVDFTDLHAWAEVYVPGAGWIGLDATSGLLVGEGHIPLAATPSPISAAPITGGHEPADVDFSFDMTVERIAETPRVTKPYTLRQWDAICELGRVVDKQLKAGDVRLSMGGEPTFVAVDDMDAPEWNTDAVGPTKRTYAEALIRRLRQRFAPGGLLHFGQGKWYPGEVLPRWALAVYWRADGKPLWPDASLIDTPDSPSHASIDDASDFIEALSDNLGFEPDTAMAAFEDPAHFLLAERNLPENVDPFDNKLDDPIERERLARVFDHGLENPRGFILPMQPWQARDGARRWMTERWRMRRKRMFLVPGDSPLGYRIPLGSLPHVPEPAYPHVIAGDPMAAHAALPSGEVLMQARRAATRAYTPGPERTGTGADTYAGPVRTALAVEPRGGHLYVFLPPVEDAEDYTALIAAIHETARQTGQKIQLEGYGPPDDARLNVLKVATDPGVIEVNIHPAREWDEAVAITTGLYEDAHHCRLGTEKFMLDGRHTGTGGGNHIVLGGITPADSPFLRRPDLLASLITYWQHHPALSYMFSGVFIGPTSQAPRVDEARQDTLYELEIALAQVPPPGKGHVPPWLVDRLFRNLLIDVTGNTHRAEICIDKLYSPDGPTGRLGLVEFRSFEMPPHAQMSLAQQLLLRALIAWFWRQPYRGGLVRWGTALHDRFMLPHFVWDDLLDVLRDLRSAGFDFAPEWFAPHFEFRFPLYGKVEYAGIEIELRQALEPWHVMGEEGMIGGTVRYVDSSVERLQVCVRGGTDGRHVVTCNGLALPLAPAGGVDCTVAGVRYRAWQPPLCLHPTIGVHTPLTFDVVDTWSARSIGGCRYHVSHPGGRAFDTFPVNAYEAEGRRLARFEAIGHSAGTLQPRPPERNREFPHTLDLRRFS
jgi:uncharacterized protein (DUF2126 family)